MASQIEKSRIRSDVLRVRGSLSHAHREAAESRVAKLLNDLCSQLSLSSVASYQSLQSEISLDAWHATSSIDIYYPRVQGEQLLFLKPQGPASFETSSLGVREPKVQGATERPVQNLDAVVVPGVAFDRRGYRLGYGKGYYDRALSNYIGIKIGVGFRAQLLDQNLPVESHDQQMDYIVTEDFILSPIKTEKRGNA